MRRGGDSRDRGIRLPAPLVEEEPDSEQRRRAEERKRDPRLDPDPAAVDGDDEEEDDPDQDREPADRGEDPPTEQVFERLSGPHDLARRRRSRR